MNTSITTLQALTDKLRAAKALEAEAREHRMAIEEQILACLTPPADGESTARFGELSIVWKLTRKVDTEALQGDWGELQENAQRAFRWKADVELKQLRALQELDPGAYAAAARFITTSPAKPAITLKEST